MSLFAPVVWHSLIRTPLNCVGFTWGIT